MNKLNFNTPPALSLYVHIPWCVRKCPYCDFNSHTSEKEIPENKYVAALMQDLSEQLHFVQGREVQSIFFGGGTPSLFSENAIANIIDGIGTQVGIDKNAEITLEANPGTIEQHRFKGYFSAGINRLSIGVQSFNNEHLKTLGRIHNGEEAVSAITTAQQAGFNNFNIDLMHGLPGQTASQALVDIQQAVDLGCTHLSWYQLTIEPNTAFFSSRPTLPSDDKLADIQQAGEQLLEKATFKQYEISAYCQPEKTSKHNTNYWLFGDYIGIGAGAHGKITHVDSQSITRQWNTRTPSDYLNTEKSFCSGKKTLTPEELPLEFMMNALRLHKGFNIHTFSNTTGLAWSSIENTVNSLCAQGLLQKNNNIVTTTDMGRRFLNEVLAKF